MQPARLAKRGFPLLLAATALAYFYALGHAPFFGADEPRYAEVAREMYARGDLVTPTLGGHTWFEKPALGYWAQMAGFALAGVNETAARLGPALAGWLTALLVGWMCGRVERGARGRLSGAGDESEAGEGGVDESEDGASRVDVGNADRRGEWKDARRGEGLRGLQLACAGVAASSVGLMVFARAVNFDIFLTAAVTLSLACFYAAEEERDARRGRLLLAGVYAGVGLALLSKGLVGVVLPAGVVVLYRVLCRLILLRRARTRQIPRRQASRRGASRLVWSLAWGVPLALLVAASWYAPVWYANGHAFFDEFIVRHHFSRFVSNRYHHPQPFYFYLLITPLLALPWTPILLAALTDLMRDARATSGDVLTEASRDVSIEASGDVATEASTDAETRLAHSEEATLARAALGGDALLRLRVFALAWLAAPVLFFSASQSKLPGYVLPALPGAAVLAGCALWRYARGARRTWDVRATGFVMLAAGAGAIYYAAHTHAYPTACAVAVAAPLALGGAWVVASRGERARAASVVVGASLLALMLLAGCASEGVTRRENVRDLLRLAAERGYASAPVVNLYGAERSSEYYAAGRLVYDEDGEPKSFDGVPPVAEYARARGATVLVIVPAKHAGQLTRWSSVPAELIGDNGANAIVALHGEGR